MMKKLFQWLAALFLAAALALTASGCGGKKQEALPAGSALTVRILDIGQGDAMLLSKDGEWALIDSGDVDHRPEMKKYLKDYGVKKLSKVIITHPHADHVGGMYAVFQAAEIGEIWDSAVPAATNTYRTYLKQIKARNIPFHKAEAGDVIPLFKDVEFRVAGPVKRITEGKKKTPDLNNNSIVGRLTYGGFSMLFTGDAEKAEERTILESGAELRSDVLKAGHHGSRTSTSKEFLRAVSPKAAVISAGAGNSYGLPHKETLTALEKAGVSVYRTDRDGTVTITSDGSESFTIKKEK